MGLFDFLKPASSNIDDTQAETDCAWCLDEQGTLKNQGPTDSHGICQDHSNQLRYNHHQRKFDRVPSYTTRYRDGQQTYWGEEE